MNVGTLNAAAKLGTLMAIGNVPDSQAGLSSGLRGGREAHEIAQLVSASFRVFVVCALLLGSTRLVYASDPAGTAESLDNFNTLRDPTVLSSSVGLGVQPCRSASGRASEQADNLGRLRFRRGKPEGLGDVR